MHLVAEQLKVIMEQKNEELANKQDTKSLNRQKVREWKQMKENVALYEKYKDFINANPSLL